MSEYYNLLFGLGIMFALAFTMTVISFKDIESFFIWLLIFSGFVVWSGLLPLWILVANVMIVGFILIKKITHKSFD